MKKAGQKPCFFSFQITLDLFGDPVDILHGGDLHDLFLIISRVGHALEIPGVVPPGLQAGDMLAVILSGQLQLPYRHIDPLCQRRALRYGFSFQRSLDLREDPRISKGGSADHNAVGTGTLQALHR